MESGSIAEDQGTRWSFEDLALRHWNLPFDFSIRRIGNSERIVPSEHSFVRPSTVATLEVLHRARLHINLTEVQKSADLPAIFGVAMPAL